MEKNTDQNYHGRLTVNWMNFNGFTNNSSKNSNENERIINVFRILKFLAIYRFIITYNS